MQLPKFRSTFNRKQVEEIFKQENKYISELLNLLPLPSTSQTDDSDVLLEDSSISKAQPLKVPNKSTSRAKSLVELQARIKQLSSKKGLNYKEKLLKKNLKTKLKKRDKRNKVDTKKVVLENGNQITESKFNVKEEAEDEKPTASNVEDDNQRIVYSKFDFSELGKKKDHKEKRDPQKVLNKLKKQKEKLNKLKESGESEKAVELKQKTAWKNAIAKAQGEKVKDDEQLLMKTIKKDEQKKKKSKKKWESRQENVKKSQDDRQKKRQENIDKRKKAKKVNKLKKAAKKGRIVPGM